MTARRRYWLMKSEPDAFSIDDLQRVGTEPWTGVRNYQARNNMRAMQVADGVLFYHSSCDVPGIVGVATVASAPYPDPTQFDKKSDYFDPKATREHPRWERTPIIFVTGMSVSELDQLKGYEVGAIDYISVPVVPEIGLPTSRMAIAVPPCTNPSIIEVIW